MVNQWHIRTADVAVLRSVGERLALSPLRRDVGVYVGPRGRLKIVWRSGWRTDAQDPEALVGTVTRMIHDATKEAA